MRIVCISDTHGDHRQVKLPAGDVLLHTGDITGHGSERDYLDFLEWFSAQPFTERLFVAGNHDQFLEQEPEAAQRLAEAAGVTYLCDSGVSCANRVLKYNAIGIKFRMPPMCC